MKFECSYCILHFSIIFSKPFLGSSECDTLFIFLLWNRRSQPIYLFPKVDFWVLFYKPKGFVEWVLALPVSFVPWKTNAHPLSFTGFETDGRRTCNCGEIKTLWSIKLLDYNSQMCYFLSSYTSSVSSFLHTMILWVFRVRFSLCLWVSLTGDLSLALWLFCILLQHPAHRHTK